MEVEEFRSEIVYCLDQDYGSVLACGSWIRLAAHHLDQAVATVKDQTRQLSLILAQELDRVYLLKLTQMDDRLEEEALVIAAASACLEIIFLKYYERKEVETKTEMSSRKGLLASTMNTSVKEQVFMFLHLVCHNVRFRAIEGRFFCSTWGIHTYFHIVLQAIQKLYLEFVSPPSSSILLMIINNSRFYPWFEDCVGALDGTPGNQPNNSFKCSSNVAATNAILKKFNVKCLPEHIDNHLHTVKNAWAVISKLRDREFDFAWDDNVKMITISPTAYKYLNKKIDMYDEMAIVVGKDIARGRGAKSLDDVKIHSHRNTTNLEEKDDGDNDFMKDNDKLIDFKCAFAIKKTSKEDTQR
ncbi:hypothetical protein Cgig2_009385 [Carnegiea gigantea]|uniref:Uncharacterized protein n=1 Tax=Carnegiea gigantea TaxID=171969 RepID=A0A9Q1JQK4_9CARY|nr:hypothetical protein Cgig2_009385 [Carnegiea gigantea]